MRFYVDLAGSWAVFNVCWSFILLWYLCLSPQLSVVFPKAPSYIELVSCCSLLFIHCFHPVSYDVGRSEEGSITWGLNLTLSVGLCSWAVGITIFLSFFFLFFYAFLSLLPL